MSNHHQLALPDAMFYRSTKNNALGSKNSKAKKVLETRNSREPLQYNCTIHEESHKFS